MAPTALRELTALCHSRAVPVVVDEAHGAHLRFLPPLTASLTSTCNLSGPSTRVKARPASCTSTSETLTADASSSCMSESDSPSLAGIDALDALSCGADLVVQSSHKTLGALSQAAMLHLGAGRYQVLGTDSVNLSSNQLQFIYMRRLALSFSHPDSPIRIAQ